MTETTATRILAAVALAALLVGAKTAPPQRIVVEDGSGNSVTITPDGVLVSRKDGAGVALASEGPAVVLRDAAKTTMVTISSSSQVAGMRIVSPHGAVGAGVIDDGGFVSVTDASGKVRAIAPSEP